MITAKGRLQGASLQTHVDGTLAQALNRIDDAPAQRLPCRRQLCIGPMHQKLQECDSQFPGFDSRIRSFVFLNRKL
jgi:hypothetical protein